MPHSPHDLNSPLCTVPPVSLPTCKCEFVYTQRWGEKPFNPHYRWQSGVRGMKPFSPLLFSECMVTVCLGITSLDYFCHSWMVTPLCLWRSLLDAHTVGSCYCSLSFVHRGKQKHNPPHPGFWVLQTRLLIHQVLLKSVRSRPQRDAPRTAQPQHRRPPPPSCSWSASETNWLFSKKSFS